MRLRAVGCVLVPAADGAEAVAVVGSRQVRVPGLHRPKGVLGPFRHYGPRRAAYLSQGVEGYYRKHLKRFVKRYFVRAPAGVLDI